MFAVVQTASKVGRSPWNTARMVREAGGLIWARPIAGAATMAAAARPPCSTERRSIFVMTSSPGMVAGFLRLLVSIKSRANLWRKWSQDQAGGCLLVKRPDGPVDPRVGHLAVV